VVEAYKGIQDNDYILYMEYNEIKKKGIKMKLIKIHAITRFKRQEYGGAKEYLCSCGHKVFIPVYQKEVKCIYCGKIKEAIQ